MKTDLRFAIVPKVAHPWFDEVHKGAMEQTGLLSRALGINIRIDYIAPSLVGVAEQNAVLKKLADAQPDGIAIDPVDALSRIPEIEKIRNRNVPLIVFDSPPPEAGTSSVGNDFAEQGTLAATRLVSLIGETGKVAVMQGFPTAPNHRQRYQAQIAVLKTYPGIAIVDGGADNDDISTARKEAAAALAANPDLSGYLCCDASGPIGIAIAVREAKKVGKVKVVGMDGIKPILEAIKEGVLESSASSIPKLQGSMSILMLWQAAQGAQIPRRIDTGIDLITRENVDHFLALA
jgi:ribose transport system substrate-binding protein